jgi:hypothetical protein
VKQTTLLRVKKYAVALAPALLLLGVALAVFSTTLLTNYRTFYVFPDNIDQFFAWYQKLAYAVHNGTLPIWDANVSAGHSFVGELQAGVFYPINLLWVWLFGSGQGISIFWLELIVVFHFWLASLGAYYAAKSLGLSKIGALATSLVYAYGGVVAMRSVSQTAIFFGLCYIPWVFFWFNKWLQTHRNVPLFFCGTTLGLIILAGHIQPWFHALMILSLFVVLYRPLPAFEPWLHIIGKRMLGLLAVVGISFIVASPQLILSAQYLPQAYRFVGDSHPIGPGDKVSIGTFTKTFSYEPQGILSLINPVRFPVVDGNELYIGLIGLAVIAVTIIFCRRSLREHVVWRQHKWFIVGASATATIIMIGYWTFIPALLRILPLLSQVRQLARYSIVIHFCLAILVGICLEVLATNAPRLFATPKRKLVGLAGGLAACLFLSLNTIYLFVVAEHGQMDKHFVYQNAIVAIALAMCLFFRARIKIILLIAIIGFSLVQPVWFLPRVRDFQATYPPNYYRRTASIDYLEQYYGQARTIIEDNALPVNIGDVFRIQTTNGYGATLHKEFYDFLNEPDPKDQSGLHMNLLNVRFLVSKQKHSELNLVLYDRARKIFVYQRGAYIPRSYFADQEGDCLGNQGGCEAPEVTKYSDSLINLSYNSPDKHRLVLSEVYYSGWRAYLDGKETPILRYAPAGSRIPLFRSIEVPAGRYDVEFRYQPFGI